MPDVSLVIYTLERLARRVHSKPMGRLERPDAAEREPHAVTRRLPLLVGALAFATALGTVGTAEAGHVHFGGSVHFSSGPHYSGGWGGGVHVGASFHWSRPYYGTHWGVGGHVWVGGYYPY